MQEHGIAILPDERQAGCAFRKLDPTNDDTTVVDVSCVAGKIIQLFQQISRTCAFDQAGMLLPAALPATDDLLVAIDGTNVEDRPPERPSQGCPLESSVVHQSLRSERFVSVERARPLGQNLLDFQAGGGWCSSC